MNRIEQIRRALGESDIRLPAPFRYLAQTLWLEEDSMEHARCLDGLAAYVQAEVEGAPVTRIYFKMKQHLDHCDDCAAQYVDLLELTLAELDTPLPKPTRLPPFDLSFLE